MRSDKNFFVCNRSLFKNPLWYSEKFTKGQAWVDLFGNANHSDGWFEKNGQRIDVKRGQTGRSIETLSKDWKWSRNKVKRFLKRLEGDHMIERKTNHLTTITTICNYDKFQLKVKNSEPSNELPDEPPLEPSGEPQTIKKEQELIRIKERTKLFEKAFEAWWLTYPKRNGRRIGKKDAKKKFMKMDQSEWTNLNTATINYANTLLKSGLSPSDAHRFLNETWKEYIEKADKSNNNEEFTGISEERSLELQELGMIDHGFKI
jgi:hypothetical protein